MEEAKHSFNLKFRLQGFECQLTIRDEEEGTGPIVAKAQATVRMLSGLAGVERTNGNGHAAAAPSSAHPPLLGGPPVPRPCQFCGEDSELELVHFEKDGKPRTAWKCQACGKWQRDLK